MENKDLSKLSVAELVQLTQQAEKELKAKRSSAMEDIHTAFVKMCNENGFDPREVFQKMGKSHYSSLVADAPSEGTTKRKQSSVRPQFAHPENPALTWTGRGRTPKWVLEHVGVEELDRLNPDHQVKLDELRIESGAE